MKYHILFIFFLTGCALNNIQQNSSPEISNNNISTTDSAENISVKIQIKGYSNNGKFKQRSVYARNPVMYMTSSEYLLFEPKYNQTPGYDINTPGFGFTSYDGKTFNYPYIEHERLMIMNYPKNRRLFILQIHVVNKAYIFHRRESEHFYFTIPSTEKFDRQIHKPVAKFTIELFPDVFDKYQIIFDGFEEK